MSDQTAIAKAFEGVDLWVFDLDNTLYPRPEGLWRQIHGRMQDFICDLLGVDQDAAEALQVKYFREYGLTMRGLMLNHGVDPDVFNEHAHDVDLSDIAPNAALAAAIASLPGRKVIHSNSNAGHIERVVARIGLEGVFDAAYDIAHTDYTPKPAASAYRAVMDAEGFDPSRAAMFEDMAHNLAEPHAMGMRTVWTPSGCDWAAQGADEPHVHFVAEDITRFVEGLVREGAAA